MKKVIFYVDKNSFNMADHAGVSIKVQSQVKQMQKAGFEVNLLEYEWKNSFPTFDVEPDTDFLYFRRVESSVNLFRKLRQLKRKAPGLKVIMEIPTYPFKGEQVGRRSLKRVINNLIGDFLLKRVVDRLAICGQKNLFPKLYGIPVIHFKNGVDFEALPVNTYQDENPDIHMICVSGCMKAHGYDRMIEGMRNYYESADSSLREVFFHVVGTGECLKDYIEKAKKYGLYDKYVFFYGRKEGKELDAIYQKCNLAVNHLATHRVGLHWMSSLKSREYVARGLPMVMSAPIDIYSTETEKYMMFVPADESPIDVPSVINFFNSLYPNPSIHEQIRDTFFPLCDWNVTFLPILDYLQKENNN